MGCKVQRHNGVKDLKREGAKADRLVVFSNFSCSHGAVDPEPFLSKQH